MHCIVAAMTTAIEQWPPEVMESVARYLPFPDLCNLRLVSKALAILAAQETFKQHYRTKHVDMSPDTLEEFAQMTRSGLLGAQVENLVLCGLAFNDSHLERIVNEKARWVTESNGPLFSSTQHKLSDTELEKAKEDLDTLRKRKKKLEEFVTSGDAVRLLIEAFGNIAAYGKHGRLPSLTLEVAVMQEDVEKKQRPIESRSRLAVYQAAEATFRIAIGGLAQSWMSVEKLDLFTEQWHCSLGWSVLGCVEELKGPELRRSFGALRSLSLSLSADMKAGKEDAYGHEQPMAPSNDGCVVLANLLGLCSGLTHLHIHWFRLRSAKYDSSTAENLLQQAIEAQTLRNLHSLTIRGLWFQGATLLDLLKTAPITDFRLENTHIADRDPPANRDEEDDEDGPEQDSVPALVSAAWSAIFDHCSSERANMSSIYFNDLWGRRLIHFKGVPGGPRMSWIPKTKNCPTLDRKGEDVRKEIDYTYARGRPLGSPQAYNWRVMREREYGPA